ncbi:sulfurtransferase-like selenium metabolism protein YedF [Desulfobulbus alkaliphilus]|uniref:sulfurtransferase-like selenium metabolism protein YedF n=1 Tax=Desulfobulbus alkaliphilus TaxID=869814 RepID=UPI0019650CC8|nr:sulfurtransferase-like selenium metabolism protein YedF [Desulfobulbus alkaliphilus]MBM9536645.1 sulfurtransferase-like selenium metabolism protein YedF [Desulfobulbus alkaliphilus]
MTYMLLDCSGLACPQPVLRTKETLEQGAVLFDVVVDNEASKNNILRFAGSQGHHAEVIDTRKDRFTIRIQATATPAANQPFTGDAYQCDPPEGISMIYVISADAMGRGNDQLGWALLQTYIQTIKEVSPLPDKILLYNSGVKLVTAASGALTALEELQAKGVEILACGTCLDFYKLKSAIKVGRISNMYDIMQAMADADKIVSPL